MRLESRDLAAGQIWADCRHVGRLVQILRVNEQFVFIQSVQLAPGRSQRMLGCRTRVLRSRFKPGSQGYSYVRDAEIPREVTSV